MPDHSDLRPIEEINTFSRLNFSLGYDYPVKQAEFGILLYIYYSKEDVTPAMAAENWNISRPRITTLTNTLEKKGFLIKTKSKTDERSVILTCTNKARRLIKHGREDYYKVLDVLIEKMGKDKFDDFIDLLEEVNNSIIELNQSK